MGRRGPRPKPTALKILQGTYRPDRAPANEPKPAPDIPNAPTWMGRDAKREWRRVVNHLAGVGMLTQLDRGTLALYCEAFQEYMDAKRDLKKAGGLTTISSQGTLIAHPVVTIRNNAWQRMLAAAREFGMTPAARTRINVTPEQDEKVDNPFMKLAK